MESCPAAAARGFCTFVVGFNDRRLCPVQFLVYGNEIFNFFLYKNNELLNWIVTSPDMVLC